MYGVSHLNLAKPQIKKSMPSIIQGEKWQTKVFYTQWVSLQMTPQQCSVQTLYTYITSRGIYAFESVLQPQEEIQIRNILR